MVWAPVCIWASWFSLRHWTRKTCLALPFPDHSTLSSIAKERQPALVSLQFKCESCWELGRWLNQQRTWCTSTWTQVQLPKHWKMLSCLSVHIYNCSSGKEETERSLEFMANRSCRIRDLQLQWETLPQNNMGSNWGRHVTSSSGFHTQVHELPCRHRHTHIHTRPKTKTIRQTQKSVLGRKPLQPYAE